MEVRAITINVAGMVSERSIQGNESQVQQQQEHMFGAECKVTISQEGRKLSRQQTEKRDGNIQNVKTEKTLLRQQKEAEQSKDIKEEYRDKLNEIDKEINALNSSGNKKKDSGEIIDKQQEVLRAMRNQKVRQDEQNEMWEKEARKAAMQSAGYKDEIDQNNRELLTLLKTMEEAEKAENERNGGEVVDDGESASSTVNSVGKVIQNSATQFMMSSVKREWDVQEEISGLGNEGRQYLKLADTITQNVLDEIKNLRVALNDEAFTDEQITEMMQKFQEGMALNYKDVKNYRGWGLQILQDAREAKIQHIADDPLKGMQQTVKSMLQSAKDSVINEARQSILDETSQELADEVKKLIDERNDVNDRILQDKEEDKEEQMEKAEGKEEAGMTDNEKMTS